MNETGTVRLARADYLTGEPCVVLATEGGEATPFVAVLTLPEAMHLAAELERLASLPAQEAEH